MKNWKRTLLGSSAALLIAGTIALPTMATIGKKTAVLDYQNMKVTLNGQVLDLRDSQGNPVEPFTINGTTYLPLASVSQALGVNATWDGNTKTVVLTTNGQTPQQGGGQLPAQTGDIGVEKAKSIALNHAGLSASQVTFVRTQLDYDDGSRVYDIEFWNGNKEYDYEINASTGAIVSYDFDIEGYLPSTPSNPATGDIGEEKAKSIALNHAGVSADKAVFLLVKGDFENGRKVYDVEFYSGNKEYDYEIDAATGDIISYDFDAEHSTPPQNPGSSSYIGEARAKQIVEQKAGTTGSYIKFKLEFDDGRAVYEGELRSGRTEYDFTIDAVTGAVLEWDVDRD